MHTVEANSDYPTFLLRREGYFVTPSEAFDQRVIKPDYRFAIEDLSLKASRLARRLAGPALAVTSGVSILAAGMAGLNLLFDKPTPEQIAAEQKFNDPNTLKKVYEVVNDPGIDEVGGVAMRNKPEVPLVRDDFFRSMVEGRLPRNSQVTGIDFESRIGEAWVAIKFRDKTLFVSRAYLNEKTSPDIMIASK